MGQEEPAQPSTIAAPWLELGRTGQMLQGTLAAQSEAVPVLIWQKRAQR